MKPFRGNLHKGRRRTDGRVTCSVPNTSALTVRLIDSQGKKIRPYDSPLQHGPRGDYPNAFFQIEMLA